MDEAKRAKRQLLRNQKRTVRTLNSNTDEGRMLRALIDFFPPADPVFVEEVSAEFRELDDHYRSERDTRLTRMRARKDGAYTEDLQWVQGVAALHGQPLTLAHEEDGTCLALDASGQVVARHRR